MKKILLLTFLAIPALFGSDDNKEKRIKKLEETQQTLFTKYVSNFNENVNSLEEQEKSTFQGYVEQLKHIANEVAEFDKCKFETWIPTNYMEECNKTLKKNFEQYNKLIDLMQTDELRTFKEKKKMNNNEVLFKDFDDLLETQSLKSKLVHTAIHCIKKTAMDMNQFSTLGNNEVSQEVFKALLSCFDTIVKKIRSQTVDLCQELKEHIKVKLPELLDSCKREMQSSSTELCLELVKQYETVYKLAEQRDLLTK